MNATFQFPLPLFAKGQNQTETMELIISFSYISTGMHRLKVLSPSQVEQELANIKLPKRNSEVNDEEIKIIALGCVFCNVSHPENTSQAKWRFKSYQEAEAFLESWKAAGRTAPWTRVPATMAFEARDGTARTYQRFTALCAVNAAIGSKPFAIVTRNRVRAGMLGYSSGKVLFDDEGNITPAGRALLDSREDQQRVVITTSQARTFLDNFVKTRLLNRFTPYRGSFTYYSKNNPDNPQNMTAEKIGVALLARVQRTGHNPKLNQIGEQIRQARQGQPLLSGDVLLSGEDLEKSPHNTGSPHNRETATQSPPDHHLIATQSPHNAALNAAKNAAKNASLNADGSFLNSEEKAIEAKPEHYPDGGEPTLDEVKSFMESQVAGSSQTADNLLKAMRKRGWIDVDGQPVTDWKPVFEKLCQ
jgi:hypothetical protein